MKTITLFTAGVSRGVSGPAAVGVQIVDDIGEVLQELSKAIGNATTEYAEYCAVLQSLQVAVELFGQKTRELSLEIKITGVQTVKQLNNEVPITHPALVPYFIAIHNLQIESVPKVRFTHVASEQNEAAYRLANEALPV